MFTLSDSDWMAEARRREIYQASEARWSMEGVTVQTPQDNRSRLDKLKTLINSFKTSSTSSDLTDANQILPHQAKLDS